jgi:hypothetical protein
VRQRLIWYEVHFPREVDESHLLQVFRLLATSGGTPLVLEVVGSTDSVTHRLGVMESRAGGLATQLRQAVPGLDLVSIERSAPTITFRPNADSYE